MHPAFLVDALVYRRGHSLVWFLVNTHEDDAAVCVNFVLGAAIGKVMTVLGIKKFTLVYWY